MAGGGPGGRRLRAAGGGTWVGLHSPLDAATTASRLTTEAPGSLPLHGKGQSSKTPAQTSNRGGQLLGPGPHPAPPAPGWQITRPRSGMRHWKRMNNADLCKALKTANSAN